jgi:tetratricopeptide (TPR) repeat protein
MTNLGLTYFDMGKFEESAGMFEICLPAKRRVFGEPHPWTQQAMSGLAKAYDALGRQEDALPLWRELIDLRAASAESLDADANTLNNTAWDLLTHDIEQVRDPERALGYAERACALEEAAGGTRLWTYLDTLALAQHRTDDTAAAVATQQRAISLMPSSDADPEMHDRLAEYEAALAASEGDDGGP